MITLYIKSPCQFSARAISACDAYGVPFVEKNIADPEVERELMEIGGRHKVPFLIDGDIKLYESEEIVAYIEEQYGKGEKKLRILDRSDADTCGI